MENKLTKQDLKELVNPVTETQQELVEEVMYRFNTSDPSRALWYIENADNVNNAARKALVRKLKDVVNHDPVIQ